jgi:hypothetical protein
VDVWDDAGAHHEARPVHGVCGEGWSETSLELAPGPGPQARALALRLTDLPRRSGPGRPGRLHGPFLFCVALPPA